MNSQSNLSLSVIVPALNEGKTVRNVVNSVLNTLNSNDIDFELLLVDDGSTDNTLEIFNEFSSNMSNIHIIKHERSLGIGASFREAANQSCKDIVTWIPADGENNLSELLHYISLFKYLDIVIPFVVNTGVRNWFRRFLSSTYLFIVNISFGTTFNYTNGTVMYKRNILKNLSNKADGFFFQTEYLIKAIRKGYVFAEVPVTLNERVSSKSKAVSLKSLLNIIFDFLRLFVAVHVLRLTGKIPNK